MSIDFMEPKEKTRLGWCGVGVKMRAETIAPNYEDLNRPVRGYVIELISAGSDLQRYRSDVVTGDVIVAMKDERYGDQWIPMRMVEEHEPLPNGMVPDLRGPEDTKVRLRIMQKVTNTLIDVVVMRGPFVPVYDPKQPDMIVDVVRSSNAINGCAFSQIDPLGLPKFAWAEVDVHGLQAQLAASMREQAAQASRK